MTEFRAGLHENGACPSPCCVVTSRLLSPKLVLFPTSTTITSLPRSPRTSSIHFRVCSNVFFDDIS